MYNPKSIKFWAEDDRPREKLLLKGKAVLSNAELLGIILGSGTKSMSAVELGKKILQEVGDNLNELARLQVEDLKTFKGIGEAKAVSIVSAMELGRRRKEFEEGESTKISSGQDVYKFFKPDLLDLPHEEFWILLLNRANRVIRKIKISSGGISGTVADPKMIFKRALEYHSSSIILIHNHPSGNLKPSEQDKHITQKMKKAGEFLEISVLDHIIFHNNGYFSFADEGIL